MGVFWTVLLAWTLQGGLGLSVVPYAVTDSTREASFSPYLRVRALGLAPGLSATLALRGYLADTARPQAPPLRLLTARITYQRGGLRARLGRQFQFVGLGGLVDGLCLGVHTGQVEWTALLGYRAPSLWEDTLGLELRSQNPLLALQTRYTLRPRLQVYAGYGRETADDTLLQAPLWLGLSTYGRAWTLQGELAYDLEHTVLSRGHLSASYRLPAVLLDLQYRYQDPWRDLMKFSLPYWIAEDPVRFSQPTHRLEASARFTRGLPGLDLGFFSAHNAVATYTHGWVAYRIGRFSARLWAGQEWEGTAYGTLLTYGHPLRPGVRLWLQARWARSPRYAGAIYSFRPRLVWRFASGPSLQAELRFWKRPGVAWETQGYLGLYLPFSRRFGT